MRGSATGLVALALSGLLVRAQAQDTVTYRGMHAGMSVEEFLNSARALPAPSHRNTDISVERCLQLCYFYFGRDPLPGLAAIEIAVAVEPASTDIIRVLRIGERMHEVADVVAAYRSVVVRWQAGAHRIQHGDIHVVTPHTPTGCGFYSRVDALDLVATISVECIEMIHDR